MPRKKDQFKEGTHVTPVGRTLPHAKGRLYSLNEDRRERDPEWIMMTLWDKKNVRRRGLNAGAVPVDAILHTCTRDCGKNMSVIGSDRHEYVEPDPHDVEVICATVQWLATNCGRSFWGEFDQKLKELRGA